MCVSVWICTQEFRCVCVCLCVCAYVHKSSGAPRGTESLELELQVVMSPLEEQSMLLTPEPSLPICLSSPMLICNFCLQLYKIWLSSITYILICSTLVLSLKYFQHNHPPYRESPPNESLTRFFVIGLTKWSQNVALQNHRGQKQSFKGVTQIHTAHVLQVGNTTVRIPRGCLLQWVLCPSKWKNAMRITTVASRGLWVA